MSTKPEEFWMELNNALVEANCMNIGDADFISWFQKAELVSDEPATITISLPEKFLCVEVKKRFEQKMLECAQAIDPGKSRVDIILMRGAA